MLIVPTTYGLGPFQPAIRIDEQLIVHPEFFKTEDEALAVSNAAYAKMKDAVELELAKAYFIYEQRG